MHYSFSGGKMQPAQALSQRLSLLLFPARARTTPVNERAWPPRCQASPDRLWRALVCARKMASQCGTWLA
jgi:hypothetical protein